jgi:hypothetical protein
VPFFDKQKKMGRRAGSALDRTKRRAEYQRKYYASRRARERAECEDGKTLLSSLARNKRRQRQWARDRAARKRHAEACARRYREKRGYTS